MVKVFLQKHDIYYAQKMSQLMQEEGVRKALGLQPHEVTVEAMQQFVRWMQLEETYGTCVSRMIMNEDFELIGVITLQYINEEEKTCHISTWLGQAYWGQGYNELAKEKILNYAFVELGLQYVFAGAHITNTRSLKAQMKLPYMSMQVEESFPLEHKRLERRERTACILNVITRNHFLNWKYEGVAS